MDLYDEFGNYIGPPLSASSYDSEESSLEDSCTSDLDEADLGPPAAGTHPVAEYYASAAETYGDAEVLVEEIDTQALETPIIKPVIEKSFDAVYRKPPTNLSTEWLEWRLRESPSECRNVAVVGALHHGKSTLVDAFVEATHEGLDWGDSPWTDYRQDEQARHVSIKAVPVTIVIDGWEQSRVVTFFDTPGHPDFYDETLIALAAVDGVIFVVDALEGLTASGKKLLTEVLRIELDVVLIITKIDRLCLELNLPPEDAFHKLRHVIGSVNEVANSYAESLNVKPIVFSPNGGNCLFASFDHRLCFSLESFARQYGEQVDRVNVDLMDKRRGMRSEEPFKASAFAPFLWGDFYRSGNQITKEPQTEAASRLAVSFVLEPLWKVLALSVSEEAPALKEMVAHLGFSLPAKCYKWPQNKFLREVCRNWMNLSLQAVVEAVVKFVPPPNNEESVGRKLGFLYSGIVPRSEFGTALKTADRRGSLVAHVVKSVHRASADSFDGITRIYSGTIKLGDRIRVLGAAFSPSNREDSAVREVTGLWIFQGRYRQPVKEAFAGQVCLVGGIADLFKSSATLAAIQVDAQAPDVEIFKLHLPPPVYRISIEPLRPSELPDMVSAIRGVERSYPSVQTRVDESGEHVVMMSGELMADCVLHDIRNLYGSVEVNLSLPTVALQETVIEESAVNCWATSPNSLNKITTAAAPLDSGIVKSLSQERRLDSAWLDPFERSNLLKTDFGWDCQSAKSVWDVGPLSVAQRPSCFIADWTLKESLDSSLREEIREPLTRGFQWASREGPLIEEPLRGVNIMLLEAELSSERSKRTSGQLIPTMRRSMFGSLLLASPKIMEPILFVEIICKADLGDLVASVLGSRRGYITEEFPRPGAPLTEIHGLIPALDATGFETDLRVASTGQCQVLQYFDHWSIVPGDPLDRSILLEPLQPAPAPHLARELVLKTRRRKGLTEDVQPHLFFEKELLDKLGARE